jgi:hypothetical protein
VESYRSSVKLSLGVPVFAIERSVRVSKSILDLLLDLRLARRMLKRQYTDPEPSPLHPLHDGAKPVDAEVPSDRLR